MKISEIRDMKTLELHAELDRLRRHGGGLAESRYQDDSCVCDCGVRDNAHQSQRCRRRWRCCGHACFVGRDDSRLSDFLVAGQSAVRYGS